MKVGNQNATHDVAKANAQALLLALGVTPVGVQLPGAIVFDQNEQKIATARQTEEYRELVALRDSDKISTSDFYTAFRELVNKLDKEGRLD